MKYIIDASCWIEYLEGSSSGEKVNQILNNEETYVLPITISEVIGKTEKSGKNTETAYKIIIKNSKIIQLTPKMAKEAGILYIESRKKKPSFSIVDALLIQVAKSTKSNLLTTDNHFKNFKEAIII